MEQQKLPNATMIIVVSIFGYLCCCFAGLGILPSAIALVMANKSQKIYKQNPGLYANLNTIKTGKTIALIALILNILVIFYLAYWISQIGWSAWSEEFSRKWQEGIESGRQY